MLSSKKQSSFFGAGFAVPLIVKKKIPLSPWELYQQIPGTGRSFFLDAQAYLAPRERYSYIGWNPPAHLGLAYNRLQIESESYRLQKSGPVTAGLREFFGHVKPYLGFTSEFFTGGAVGYFAYELAGNFERISFRPKQGPVFPKLELLFVRDLIAFDHKENLYYFISWLVPKKGLSFTKALRQSEEKIAEMENLFSSSNGHAARENFDLHDFRPEISREAFEKMVRKTKSYIQAGDIYQANLSQRFSFKFEGSPLWLYGRLREINPAPYSAFLRLGDLVIASSSPELLVAKQGRDCVTCPIAGTRPRGQGAGETNRLARELLASEKERAEHLMLVDLERNDLGRVSEWRSVQVKDFMRIEQYARVIHLVSEVTSRMRAGKDAWDLIQAVFPGGTITGCPKIRAMEIIDELEPVERGIYTGSIGYIGFDGNLKLNIAIRTLVLQKNRGYLQVGAGIVADSDPAREYEETLHKGEALAEALLAASTRSLSELQFS